MSRRSIAVTGPLEPAAAWERYAVPARWPEWAPPIRAVEYAEPRLRPGATGTVHVLGGPGLAFAVLACDDAARTWTWRVRLGPSAMVLDHEVLARPGGGSVATLTVDAPAPLALLYPELARIALHRLLR